MAIKTYTKGAGSKLSANFTSSEFDCHGKGCCSSTLIDEKLVKYIQQIRDHFGKPVIISSGYRCPQHNKKIGGATSSYHMKGRASDIYIKGVAPAEIAKYAESIGILGIGLYETNADGHFVHIDTRTSKYFWYGQSNKYRSTFGGAVAEDKSKEQTKQNTKIDTVKEVQEWANTNYKSGLETDGVYGAETKKALIKILQEEINKKYKVKLKMDGIWGSKTREACPTISVGSNNAFVSVLQALLVCNKIRNIDVDGKYGSATYTAVQTYQRMKNIDDDGTAGKDTFTQLCK